MDGRWRSSHKPGQARSACSTSAQGDKEVYLTTDGACTAFQRRPFLKQFLEEVCQLFEVAVFTAGSRVRLLLESCAEPHDAGPPHRDLKRHHILRSSQTLKSCSPSKLTGHFHISNARPASSCLFLPGKPIQQDEHGTLLDLLDLQRPARS